VLLLHARWVKAMVGPGPGHLHPSRQHQRRLPHQVHAALLLPLLLLLLLLVARPLLLHVWQLQ
jgi:hypothetical protein